MTSVESKKIGSVAKGEGRLRCYGYNRSVGESHSVSLHHRYADSLIHEFPGSLIQGYSDFNDEQPVKRLDITLFQLVS